MIMKTFKNAFIAVITLCAVSAAAPALPELNSLTGADIPKLSDSLDLQIPKPSIAETVAVREGSDPVVITVAGLKFGEIGWGPFELRNLFKLIDLFFPGNTSDGLSWWERVKAFYSEHLFLENDEDVRAMEQTSTRHRWPDNYLETKLQSIPGFQLHDIVVIPFPWSREPSDTNTTVPLLENRIIEIYDTYKATGRPIYILAHSWGTVLAHEALHRVEIRRPDVKIAKLITAGSPLVPSNPVVELFLRCEVYKEHLTRAVTKPANVGVWHNLWAKRDMYSNAIPAADSNYQADANVENVEPLLIQLILHNKLLKADARHDLIKMRNIKDWHAAYFFDYKASLKSLGKEIFVPIFRPVVAPEVMNYPKKPSAAVNE